MMGSDSNSISDDRRQRPTASNPHKNQLMCLEGKSQQGPTKSVEKIKKPTTMILMAFAYIFLLQYLCTINSFNPTYDTPSGKHPTASGDQVNDKEANKKSPWPHKTNINLSSVQQGGREEHHKL
jgi:hypothetical protein